MKSCICGYSDGLPEPCEHYSEDSENGCSTCGHSRPCHERGGWAHTLIGIIAWGFVVLFGLLLFVAIALTISYYTGVPVQ